MKNESEARKMEVYYGNSGELMARIPLSTYEELLMIKGRYLELREQHQQKRICKKKIQRSENECI